MTLCSANNSTKKQRHYDLPFILILVAFIILGVIYSVTTPIFEASDELWHYPFVEHLATGGSLPVQDPDNVGLWRQEASQPPLYYAIGALATSMIDTSDLNQVRQINPHASIGVPTDDRNINMTVHSRNQAWPYSGTVLAVHIVRWLSVLMGAVTVTMAYLTTMEVLNDRLVAWTAAAFTAFNSMYLFITSSVNNDALVTMLTSISLWLIVRIIRRYAHNKDCGLPRWHEWLVLGIAMGAACLSKTSGLAILPFSAVAVGLVTWRNHSWKEFFRGALLLLVPVLAIAGWWYVRNWQLYGDLTGMAAMVSIVGARNPVPTLAQLAGEWRGFVMAFWGFFGGVNVPTPNWFYTVWNIIATLGFTGIPVYLWRRKRSEPLSIVQWQQLGLVTAWPLVVFIALVRWTMMTIASQGRLMFPALTGIALLIAMGLCGWLPSKIKKILPAISMSWMLATAIYIPFGIIAPAYAYPEILTEGELPDTMVSVEAQFAQHVVLKGYELSTDEAAPGDSIEVTLYWQDIQAMIEDFSIFVHLVDDNGVILAQYDVYPGQGNYPTTFWQLGDLFADTIMLDIPEGTYTPNEASVVVGLYRLEDGTRLPVSVEGTIVGDSVELGSVSLPATEKDGIPNPVSFNLEDKISLIGFSLDKSLVHPGETVELVLYWQALADIDADYSVFTHIIATDSTIYAQKDGWPQEGAAPTSSWAEGQIIEDHYILETSADAVPGLYELETGMYDGTGERLTLLGDGGFALGNRILLGNVRIAE